MRRRNVLIAVTCLGLLAALALGLLCGGLGNDGAAQDQGGGGKEALLRLGSGFDDLGFKRFVIRHKATVLELDRRRGLVRLALPGKLSGGDIAEAARSGAFLDKDGLKNQSGAEALATSDPRGEGFGSGAGTRGPSPKALGSLWTVSRGHSDAPWLTTTSTRSWAAAKPKAGKSLPSQAGGLTVSVSRLGGDGIAPAASLGEEMTPSPVAVAEADTSTFGSDHLVRFQGSGSYAPAGHITGWQWQVDGVSASQEMSFQRVFSAPGTYAVKLTVQDDSAPVQTGQETLAVVVSAPASGPMAADAWDPGDDTWAGATTLVPTSTAQSHGPHTLGNPDVCDWYKINMTAGLTYYFDTIGGTGDDIGSLYSDPTGLSVASNDDGGGGLQFSFSYTPPASGWYYLKVEPYDPVSGTWSGSVNYRSSGGSGSSLVWLNQYFPLMVGNSWTYSGGLTISVDAQEAVSGVQTKKLWNALQSGYIYFRQDENGTRRYKEYVPSMSVTGIFSPPLCQLPANAFVGNSYSYTSTEKVYDSGVYQGEAGVEFATDVLGYEDVTLSSPANINGTSVSSFPSCLKLSQTVTVDGDVVGPETQWYARDLGFVKISNGSGTYELTSATTYYDTAFWDTWRGRLYDSSGTYRGTMTLVLERDSSDLMGTVQLWLSDGSSYILPLVSGAPNSYASGPNAVGHATDGSNTFDFALTHNDSNLTGPFNSSFLGHGTVGPPSSGGGGGGGGGGGCSLAARPVSAGDALGWAVPYAVLFAAYLWVRFMRRSGKDGHRRLRERWSGARVPAWTAMFLLCAVLAIFGCGGGGGGGGSGGGGGGGGKPDLVDSGDALDQLVPSNLIGIGDYFQALCMIGNNGTAAAGTFYVDLYASTDSTITASDCFLARAQVSSMPAGGSDVIVIDVPSFPSIPQGDYYVGFIIDPTNAVDESDESNNVGLCTNGVLTVTSLTQLINGVPMNGAVAYGAWKYYYIDVTATTKPFTVQTTNATGDIDLYLHKGTMPTWTDYQFSAETGSGNEIITVNGGNFLLLSSGRWYIGVVGYANAGYTIAAAVGGSAVPVLVVSDGFRPHFSPDGTKIVFTRLSTAAEDSASNIWCINVDGTGLTRLTSNTTSSDFSPQWNPNGQRISFLRKTGTILSSNPGFLYDMANDGTDVVLRDPFSSLEDFCHWKQSSTSTEIVSIRTNGEVWLSMGWPNIWGQALRRSGGAHNIRSSADPAATSPAPDVAMNDTTARKIVRFNPSGLSEATLQASYDFPCPCPSPSGSKIAAGTDGGLPWGLYVMESSDGSGLMPLTTGVDQQPTWYGNTIAFVRASGGGSLRHGDIYKIDVSGFVAGSTAPAAWAAQARYVPSSDHETIQAAVNASADGDKVVVAPGEYRENLVFGGKAVTVESSDGPEQTILKPLDEKLPTVAFTAGEGPGAVLRGFTVMGGESGILVRGARPTLRGNELLCGLDCDSPLATVLTRAGNSLDAKGAGILGGLAGLDPGQLVAWVTAEPRAMFAELRRMAGKPRATAARPAVIAAASLPAISPRQGHETWLLLLGLLSLVAAMVLVAELLRRKGLARKRAWAGFPARQQPCDGGTRDKTTRRGSPAL